MNTVGAAASSAGAYMSTHLYTHIMLYDTHTHTHTRMSIKMGWDNSVGIVTRYGLNGLGIESW